MPGLGWPVDLTTGSEGAGAGISVRGQSSGLGWPSGGSGGMMSPLQSAITVDHAESRDVASPDLESADVGPRDVGSIGIAPPTDADPSTSDPRTDPDHVESLEADANLPGVAFDATGLDEKGSPDMTAAGTVPSHASTENLVSRETDETSLPYHSEAEAHVPMSFTPTLPLPTETRIFTVANQKGGVGKTTTAVNLAAALAGSGARVLLIDLDPQGNASTALGIEHTEGLPNIYDVVVEGEPLRDYVHPVQRFPSLFGVPATIDLSGAELELASVVAREARLKRALDAYLQEQEAAGQRFDYVLIDCPPSLGLLTMNALVAGREVMVPIQCEYYALEGVETLFRIVHLVQQLNTALEVSTVIMTMYDARTRLSAQVVENARQSLGETVLRSAIPRSVRISEAPSFGQTVMTWDPSSPGALSYLEAAREIALRDPGAPSVTPPRHSSAATSTHPDEALGSATAAGTDREG